MAPLLLLLAVMASSLGAPATDKDTIPLLMPGVSPQEPDTYLCHKLKVGKPTTIIGFNPVANMEIAHHMLLYGCLEPGSDKEVWNCGEMSVQQGSYDMAPTCASGAKILYAWAMDAPSLTLPPEVGFDIGGDTDVPYLVLQVHYKDVTSFKPPLNGKDKSGLLLKTTDKTMKRRAGVYLLGTNGRIPAHSIVYMETACKFPAGPDVVMHPFAFRTHAHSLGRVISGYIVNNNEWTEIGRGDPSKPQMFYNATTPGLVVKTGDVLAARCTMENTLDHEVRIGSTQNDEMCNFYVMYYVEGDKLVDNDYCFSPGPPKWDWTHFSAPGFSLENLPDNVSTIPTNNRTLIQTVTRPLARDPQPRDVDNLLAIMAALQDSSDAEYDNQERGVQDLSLYGDEGSRFR